MEEVAEVKAECATKMRAIKLAFEAGKITKDQALAKFEVLKQECAEEFEDVFEKCGPHPGPKPHDGPMDLVAMFHNVFGSPEAKSPECDAAIDDMKASCAPTDWKTFDWSKCAEACAAGVQGRQAQRTNAAIAEMDDACAASDDKTARLEEVRGGVQEDRQGVLGAKPSGNPDCDAAIAEMDDACAASDDKTAIYDWKKCAKASKKIAKACSKWGPTATPPSPRWTKTRPRRSRRPRRSEAEDARGARGCRVPRLSPPTPPATPRSRRCATRARAPPRMPRMPPRTTGRSARTRPRRSAPRAPSPARSPTQPFNFLACVAQAKMTESECAYDVQTNLAKEDKFDAYIDAFEQCEPSVDRLVQACQ